MATMAAMNASIPSFLNIGSTSSRTSARDRPHYTRASAATGIRTGRPARPSGFELFPQCDDLRQMRGDRLDYLGIEQSAATSLEVLEDALDGDRFAVRALAHDGIHDIDGAEDARLEQDGLSAQPHRIAAPVESLVVLRRDGPHVLELLRQLQASQDLDRAVDVVLDRQDLTGRQLFGFVQDRIRRAEVPAVVHRAGGAQHDRRDSSSPRARPTRSQMAAMRPAR